MLASIVFFRKILENPNLGETLTSDNILKRLITSIKNTTDTNLAQTADINTPKELLIFIELHNNCKKNNNNTVSVSADIEVPTNNAEIQEPTTEQSKQSPQKNNKNTFFIMPDTATPSNKAESMPEKPTPLNENRNTFFTSSRENATQESPAEQSEKSTQKKEK